MAPGSLEGLQLVVPDLATVRAELRGRGAEISEIQNLGGVQFAYFADPDGNRWVLQEAVSPEFRAAHLDE
jgi:catechol 2,3-dioxygenase-like lactoylglutathione lyase family enzyme